mgnify:CR=1 FL=1
MKEMLKKLLELSDEELQALRQVFEKLERIEEKEKRLSEELERLREERAKLLESLPSEFRELFEQRQRQGTGRRGVRVYVKTLSADLPAIDQEFNSVREAFYALFPDRRGKSYKFREYLEKLAQEGKIELRFI